MIIEADNILPSYRYAPSSIDTFMWLLVRNNVLEFFKIFKNSYIWLQIILGNQMSYIYIYTLFNKRIFCLDFIILRTKIFSHKFLNSLKYPYLLVK